MICRSGRCFGDAALTVERDALGYLDAEILGAGAGRFERVQQFGMCRDAGAAADQFDVRAFVHIDVPADLAQERGAEQSRHRAADDDGAAFRFVRLTRAWSRYCEPSRPSDLTNAPHFAFSAAM